MAGLFLPGRETQNYLAESLCEVNKNPPRLFFYMPSFLTFFDTVSSDAFNRLDTIYRFYDMTVPDVKYRDNSAGGYYIHMTGLKPIKINDFMANPFQIWQREAMLLCAGDFESGKFNAMTVGWGSLGTMWRKPFAQVVVRPSRYTMKFMEKYNSFTLCLFPDEYREKVLLLGRISGRDGDKIAQSGLSPVKSETIAAPGFKEAELIMECTKIYFQDMDPAGFIDPEIDRDYPENDFHRIYYGRIEAVHGCETCSL